jgi:hypothetical protein
MPETSHPRHVVVQAEGARLDLSPQPRPDGYRRLATALQTWGGLLNYPVDHRFWYVIGTARRLDTAHRQLEAVRTGLDAVAQARAGRSLNLDWIDERIAIVGDAQLAIITLSRALDAASALETNLHVQLRKKFPPRLAKRQTTLVHLRDSYEHFEHRAMGKTGRTMPPGDRRAWKAFSRAGEELEETRRMRYRRWSMESTHQQPQFA